MVTTNDVLSHYGILGMKWGIRKDEYRNLSIQDRKKYRKKTLKERSDTFKKAREKNLDLTYSTSKKYGSNVLVKSTLPGQTNPTVMTGKEFVKHLESGGAINANLTRVVAFTKTKEGIAASKIVEKQMKAIWDPTAERYVLKDEGKKKI